MNLGQLIEYKKRNIFLQKYAKNETGRLDPDLLLFFNNASCKIKTRGLLHGFNIFGKPSTWYTIKTNYI